MATDPRTALDAYEAERARQPDLLWPSTPQEAAANMRRRPNPDLAARANDYARRFQLPGETVERNIEDIEATDRASRALDISERNPRLGGWLANDRNAAVATDDMDALDTFVRAYQAFNRTAYGAFQAFYGRQLDPIAQIAAEGRLSVESLLGEAARDVIAIANAPGVRETSVFVQEQARNQVVAAMRENVQRAAADRRDIERRQARGVAGQIAGTLYGGGIGAVGGVVGSLAIVTDPIERLMAGTSPAGVLAHQAGLSITPTTDYLLDIQRRGDDIRRSEIARSDDFVADSLYRGVESIPLSVGAVLSRNPQIALGLFGASAAGGDFAAAREAGVPYPMAAIYGISQGAIEIATERLPIGTLLNHINNRTPLGRTVGAFILGEVGGEQAATVLQDLNQWAVLEENQGKTFNDYLNERPTAAAQTFFATLSGAGPQVVTAEALRRYANRTSREERSLDELQSLDSLMVAAAQSMVRERDPEAFRELLAELGDDGGDSNIFVPGDVIAQYNQDNPEDRSFAQYEGQLPEAVATGGDVVIPVDEAATRLAGTPAWEAVRRDVRASAGGASLNEIEQAQAEIEEVLRRERTAVDAEDRRQREIEAPREQMTAQLRDTLQNAGYTPDVANLYANLVIHREATRADRAGRELTGNELADVGINLVLPENLGRVVSAELGEGSGLGRIVDAMRRGIAPEDNRGPSLLEFIAERGGIEDAGGDIASMGGAEWHRGRPGRRKLLREREGGLTKLMGKGGGENTPDALAEAAWEAGYIEGADRPEINDLLEAIGRELAGDPVYAEERDAGIGQAADELYALLDSRGVDPMKAEEDEIAEVVAQYQAERSQDAGYEQTFEDGPRGRILFSEAGATIELFEQRDLSAFLHETGHLWLEQLKADAAQDDATDQVKTDYQAVLDWFAAEGHDASNGIPVDAHEMWARGVERYLMEGRAPTTALSKAFEAFRSWLLSLYRTVKALNAPITPEIREVMDRLIATDAEIAEARREQNIALAFDSAEAAGMSEAEFKAYRSLADGARNDARDTLLRKVTYAIRQKRTKEYRDIEARERREVTAEVESRPMFRALDTLRQKGDAKLSRDWLTDTYGADILGQLPKGNPLYSDQGQADADVVAETTGFKSGDEMISALVGIEDARARLKSSGDKRSVKQWTIDTETDRRMRDRYGDPLNDGSIEAEARAAIHTDRQGDVLAAELRALGRRSGRTATPYQAARRWAAERVRAGTVADMVSKSAIQRYTRAAAKAGKEAQAAIVARDTDAAFAAKQRQMIQNALAGEARKVSERVDTAVKRLGKLAGQRTIRSLAQDYLDQIHGLLEGFDFKSRSQASIDREARWQEWAAARAEEGHDVLQPPETGKHWSRMTVDELIGLDDTIKQIRHLGRLKQTLIDNEEKRQFEEVVGEALGQIGQLPPKKPKGTFAEPGYFDSIKSFVSSVDSMLLKMETVFDWLDLDQKGVFNRVVFEPLVEAQDKEFRMLNDIHGRLIDRLKQIPKPTLRRWQERVTIPELIDPATGSPAVFDREKLVAMALNMGNTGNAEKLVGGFGWQEQHGGIEGAQAVVMDVLNRELSVEEWRYVQDVWDIVNELWPEISELEKRVNGFAPDKVEAQPLDTSAGQLRGGYFPVVYDPHSRVGDRNLEVEEKGLFPSTYFKATTRSGSTQERTSFVGPLHLSLAVINRHVAEVVHDVTHREAVMQADKFLSDARVRDGVEQALGADIAAQFRPWLQHIANEWAADRETNSVAERALKGLRLNASFVGLAFRVSTVMLQMAGYSNSIEAMGKGGVRWVSRGVRRAAQHPSATWEFVAARSKEVPQRMSVIDRDIRDARRRYATRRGALNNVVKFGFHGIGIMDRVVSVGTWIGAYDKAISEGKSEKDAVYFADKIVRRSQGSNAAKDMARVQRGTGKAGEAWKLLTMFYSFLSAQYQRQRTLGRDTAEAVRERDYAEFPFLLARAWWLYVIPAVSSELLANRGPDEDEDWLMWAASKILVQAVAPIPVVREVAGGIESGFGYSYTPAEGFGRTAVNVWNDVGNVIEGEETNRMTRNIMDLLGYSTGKIPGQAGQTTQFIFDVMAGEADPEGVGDWYTGITKGRLENDK